MVERTNNNNKFGSEDYQHNAGGGEQEYYESQAASMIAQFTQGKAKHGGVGGKGSKSNNFKECKNANIRRNAKNERENNK